MTKKSASRLIRFLLAFLLLALLCFSLYRILSIYFKERQSLNVQKKYALQEVGTLVDKDANNHNKDHNKDGVQADKYSLKFKEMLSANKDFQGWLVFKNGLLNLPFVKTTNNEIYLNRSFDGSFSPHGTVFLDYFHNFNDKNNTLYGHYVYNNENLMFSPLEKLKDKDFYEQNKEIELYLKEEVREYEVVAILKYNEADYPVYAIGDLSTEDFALYQAYIEKHRLFDTGKMIKPNDYLLTLQTCVKNEDDTRWLIVAKQTRKRSLVADK